MECLRSLGPKSRDAQQLEQAARNLPTQFFEGPASPGTGDFNDLGSQVLADAGQIVEFGRRVIATPYPVAQTPLLPADCLRRALVRANPKGVFIPQRQEIGYLIEDLRNFLVLYRHVFAS
jgi:hypothetical protein